jgi:hypothetical protein
MAKRSLGSKVRSLSVAKKLMILAVGFILVEAGLLFRVELKPSPLAQRWLGKVISTQSKEGVPLGSNQVGFETLNAQVLPAQGYTVRVKWGDLGKRLVESGAIDLEKFKQVFAQRGISEEELEYLTQGGQEEITVTADSATFWVDVLWALGLTNKSEVLSKGPMATGQTPVGNYASTGGWSLGEKESTRLYNSQALISLSSEQEARVRQIADGVFRPCCNNPTSFPDCNHGMAALGLIQLMVRDGYSDKEIYQAVLAFNSFWFPQNYLDLAYYFKTKEGLNWNQVDAQKLLSATYSSGSGYKTIKQQLQPIPGQPQQGGSCGA